MITFIIEKKDGKVIVRSGLDFDFDTESGEFKTLSEGHRGVSLNAKDTNIIILFVEGTSDILYIDEKFREEQISNDRKLQEELTQQMEGNVAEIARNATLDTLAQVLYDVSEEKEELEETGGMKS